jgi:hypothetical protein
MLVNIASLQNYFESVVKLKIFPQKAQLKNITIYKTALGHFVPSTKSFKFYKVNPKARKP